MTDINFNTILAGRTHSHWLDQQVQDGLLEKLAEKTLLGPTSCNGLPLRILYVKSAAAKEKLKPFLAPTNVEKTMSAPVTAILAYDTEFYIHLPKLYPFVDAKSWFEGKPDFIEETAFRNSSIQIGYFIYTARSLGLDCGPMSGFDNEAVDAAFLSGTSWKSNVLCNLGFGDHEKLHPNRAPRHDIKDICQIL